MIWFYLISLIFTVMIMILLHISDARQSIIQYLMMMVILVSDAGYFSLAIAQNLWEALLAQRMIYVGGCFLPALYFLTVSEVCGHRIRKRFAIPLIIIQALLFVVVCSIGHSTIYYKSVSFLIINGVGQLSKVYGPCHFMYPLTLVIYFLGSVLIVIYSIIKKSAVRRNGLILMLCASGATCLCYVLQRVIKGHVDIMPISYLILMAGSIYPLYKSNTYTVEENKDIISGEIQHIGFLTFDQKLHYMGANERMLELFPELKQYVIDAIITDCSHPLQRIIESVVAFDQQDRTMKARQKHDIKLETFMLNEHYYDGTIHSLTNFLGQCVGYTVKITDETEHYTALKLSENYNEELTQEVEEKTLKIREMQNKIILGMAQMVESRDLSTGGHIKRTSEVVRIFSTKLLQADLGFDRKFLKFVIRSAPMHDLGKIGVDDAILRKQGRFEPFEYEQMKTHSAIGAKIVREVLTDVEDPKFVEIAENVAHYHHEKIDGTGYPEGLKGDEIPIEARIMALADVFDALVSKRCYKDAFSYDRAFRIIEEDSGTHFDAELARIFISCREDLEAYYNQENCR